MLANDRETAERDLSIARYAVIPLSPNSGLIGWVPNTDTLHALIREYRDSKKIPLNWEHRWGLLAAWWCVVPHADAVAWRQVPHVGCMMWFTHGGDGTLAR